jgi:hypothetical protein
MSHGETESDGFSLPPSKRAARRIIQRAFVLTGRDKHLRQHLRAARLTILWILEDWDLVWSVIVDRGKIEFDRRPAKHPDLTLSWQNANEFFSSARLSFRVRVGQRPTHESETQDVTPATLVLRESGGAGVHVEEELHSRFPAFTKDKRRGNDVAFDGGMRGVPRDQGFRSETPIDARKDGGSALPESAQELAGNIEFRRIVSHLLNSFLGHLGHVLRNPVDGAGESLL